MAEEIRQELTFDASQAIQSLDQLTKSLGSTRNAMISFGQAVGGINKNASSATASLSTLATAAAKLRNATSGGILPNAAQGVSNATGLVDQFGNSLTKTSAASKRVSAASTSASVGMQNVGRAAKNAAGNVTTLKVSFGTLARVIQTQLIVRAFGAFTRGLATATKGAAEFQKQISEIQTITDNAFRSFDRAAEAVRGISDAFNQPLGEVSEGLYQIISNQIQGASTQIRVLEAASNLAKVGVADLSNTVGLLTGTINAFQLDANDANRIAAVFFETVRLGRTRISELANSFGTVATLADAAGIEFEELAAAFATVTVAGVDTAKAATQLRGIINAFLKPTKELKEVLDEAGFSSGELAIQTLGLGGALALLQKRTGGSATEMAKLIPRVRGLAGTFTLARNNGDDLVKTTEQIKAASQDLLREKLDIRLETNAEQVEAELNRIKNALTVDLGQAILEVVKKFADLSGGASTLVPIIKSVTPLLILTGVAAIGAALSLGLYALAAKTASGANLLLGTTSRFARRGLLSIGVTRQLTRSLLGFARSALPVAIGFAIGAALGKGINDALVDSAKRSAKEAGDAIREGIVTGEQGERLRQIEKEGAAQIKSIKAIIKEQQASLNEEKRLQSQRTTVFLDANRTIFEDSVRIFDAIIDANKKLIRGLEQEQRTASRAQESSISRQANLRDTIEDRAFKNSISRLNDRQKLFRLESQGARLAAQANRELASAQTAQEAATAIDKLGRAEGFLNEADAIARSSGELRLQNRLFQLRQSISQRSLQSERAFANTQATIKKQAEAALKTERTRVETLNREVQEAKAAVAEFKKAKTAEEQLTAARKARAEIADITPELAFGADRLDFAQLVSFDRFKDNLSQSIQDTGVDLTIDPSIKLEKLSQEFFIATRTSVIKAIRSAEAAIAVEGIELKIKLDVEESGIAQLQSSIDQLLKSSQTAQSSIEQGVERIRDTTRRLAAGQAALVEAGIEANNAAAKFITLGGFLGAGKVTPFEDALERVKTAAVDIANNFQNLTPGDTLARLQNLRDVFTQLEAKAGFFDKAETTVLRTEIDALINKLLEANEVSFDAAVGSSQQIENNISSIPLAGQALNQQLDISIQKTAQIARNLSQGSVPAAATAQIGRFFPKFLAGGGFSPRGTDNIPAMLSKGEFVVNARSTSKFFSQLQAINAGVQPIFRQDGGPVTNVGDINVTVTGGKDADRSGRIIARRIKRELRRGTSSL